MSIAHASHLGDVLVLGLGKTGTEVARYVAAQGERASSVTLYGGSGSSASEVTRELEAVGVRVVLGTEDVEGAYDLAVASPGISEFSPFFQSAAASSAKIVSEPEFAWQEAPYGWVAITGTNGKTTTTSLTTRLLLEGGLDAVSVGNIGNLVTGELADRADDSWFVAELSSFQLARAQELHPRVACLLNITPDHIEWHKTLANYASAKERIFKNLTAGDLAVISDTDEWCHAIRARLEQRGLRVLVVDATGDPQTPLAAFVRDGAMVVRLDGVEHGLVSTSELPIKGTHNVVDALAAAAMALELGVSAEAVRQGLLAFRALEHRIEPCGEVRGVHFVNDSKATNIDSVEKALGAFAAGTVVVLLGGHDKGTAFDSLAAQVALACRAAVCYGEAGERIARAIEEARGSSDVRVVRAPHMREAFAAALDEAQPGDTVLLSPACSSFDEFNNMGERGRLFKQLVRDLASGEGR